MAGPFDMTQQFPIAAVINAIQKKAVYENQMRQQQNQDLLQGIQGLADAAPTIAAARQRMAAAMTAGVPSSAYLPQAQSSALGSAYGIDPSITNKLTPEQVQQVGTQRSHQVDLNTLAAILGRSTTGSGAGTPAISPAANPSSGGSSPASPLMLTNAAASASAPPAAVAPTAEGAAPAAPPPPAPAKFVSPATLSVGMRLAKAARPTKVMTQQQALAAGSVPQGTRIINPNSGSQGVTDPKYQDRLEEFAMNGMRSIRGDTSLAHIEGQRDAAISAYNRLSQIEMSGKAPNPVDYVDILGQIYKARTGQAPTETVLNDARQQTLQGNLGKVYTWATGNQAPATTRDIASSLKDMATHMGIQADQLHDGYMQTHLAFPSDLEPSRAAKIKNLARGKSFSQATGVNPLDFDPHAQAMKWAQEHPNDPRANAVMQKALQAQGGGQIGL